MHTHETAVKNPGTFELSSANKSILVALTVIGVATFAAALKFSPERAWVSFVHNHFYFMSLGLGGLFYAAVQWVTGAMWSAPVRRLSESFTAYLPFVLVTFLVLYIGVPNLYSWSHMEHVKGDLVLEGKSSYLNVSFFLIRNLIAIGLWLFFSYKMIGNSLAQDKSKAYTLTLKNRVLSPIFIIVFAISFTMASFDQIMSLDPHWFSTMFGVYCFAGLFYANLAATALLTIYMRSKGKLDGIVNDEHIHDLGKFMFGIAVFWAYIGFCQFMLIWYANLPEETGYFMRRFEGGWGYVSLFLLLGKFLFPFLVLLPREAKRHTPLLKRMAWFMIVAQWIDVMWMVQPEFFKAGPVLGWVELGMTLGFVGIFGLMVSRFLEKNSIVAVGDPRLAESVHHHVVGP